MEHFPDNYSVRTCTGCCTLDLDAPADPNPGDTKQLKQAPLSWGVRYDSGWHGRR